MTRVIGLSCLARRTGLSETVELGGATTLEAHRVGRRGASRKAAPADAPGSGRSVRAAQGRYREPSCTSHSLLVGCGPQPLSLP